MQPEDDVNTIDGKPAPYAWRQNLYTGRSLATAVFDKVFPRNRRTRLRSSVDDLVAERRDPDWARQDFYEHLLRVEDLFLQSYCDLADVAATRFLEGLNDQLATQPKDLRWVDIPGHFAPVHLPSRFPVFHSQLSALLEDEWPNYVEAALVRWVGEDAKEAKKTKE